MKHPVFLYKRVFSIKLRPSTLTKNNNNINNNNNKNIEPADACPLWSNRILRRKSCKFYRICARVLQRCSVPQEEEHNKKKEMGKTANWRWEK